MNKSILIVGCGVVGTNLYNALQDLRPEVYDKYKKIYNYHAYNDKDYVYDFCFICVNTPYIDKNNPCDITEVEAAINEIKAENYIIKSTILPETTEKLVEKYHKHIIFSPEYYGATQHCNNYNFDFTILGGEKATCIKVVQLLQNIYDGRHEFRIVDSKTAELTKYMENCWLATKVSFCNQFYDIAQQCGVNYEELRELFILDPRVNPSHTFVYAEHPYWSSHCLDKDVPAIAETANAELLQAIIDFNNKRRPK